MLWIFNICPTSPGISASKLCGAARLHNVSPDFEPPLVTRMSKQESVEGLSSLMALGYLNLSGNPLTLKALRPLAHAHVLELFLGSVRSGEERRRTLALLPNVWVLDDEYVTTRERRAAEDDYSHGAGETNGHLLQTWNNSSLLRSPGKLGDDDGAGSRHVGSINEVRPTHQRPRPQKEPGGASGFGSLETQGHQVHEFYEHVVWKIPSRWGLLGNIFLGRIVDDSDEQPALQATGIGEYRRLHLGRRVKLW